MVVVDHAPKVGPERMDKLKTVLKKVLGRFGDIVSEYYPTDEKGIFKGWDNRNRNTSVLNVVWNSITTTNWPHPFYNGRMDEWVDILTNGQMFIGLLTIRLVY